jgi:MFS family permease
MTEHFLLLLLSILCVFLWNESRGFFIAHFVHFVFLFFHTEALREDAAEQQQQQQQPRVLGQAAEQQQQQQQPRFLGQAPLGVTVPGHAVRVRSNAASSSLNAEGDENNNDNDNDDNGDGLYIQEEQRSSSKQRSNIPSLVCALMASMTSGGTTYAFGMYGDALKKTLGLSQTQLDTISTTFFFAGLFSWIPGLLADRFGTRFTMSLGGMLGCTSLLTYWAVARQFIVCSNKDWLVFTLSLLGICIFLSSACVTGSVFKIITMTCHEGTKGSAVGIAKGYVGLGSGMYACIYEGLRRPNQSDLDFLPMAAVFCLCCATLPALVLLPNKVVFETERFHEHATPFHFRVLYLSLIAMAVLIVGNSLLALEETAGMSSVAATLQQKQESLKQILEFSEHGEEAQHQDDDDNDDNENDLGGLPDNPFFFEDSAPVLGSAKTATAAHHNQNLFMSFLLAFIWLAPILFLLVLPKRQSEECIYDDIAPDGDEHEPYHDQVESTRDTSDIRNDDALQESGSLARAGAPVVVDTGNETTTAKSRTSKNKNGATTVTLRRPASIPPPHEEVGLLMAQPPPYNNNTSSASMDGSIRSSSTIRSRPGVVEEEDDDDIDHHYENTIVNHASSIVGDRSLVQMLQTPSAWLMLWTATILVGAGTVETNNMGQMVEALGFDKAVTPASLALFSVAQAFSRVMTGAISESALNWNTRYCLIDNGVPRPFFLVLASLLGCCAHFMLGMAVDQTVFVVGSLLAGAAFGMVWPLMVLVSGEFWGKSHVGANYMFFDGFTSAIGTLLLSKIIAQEIYESHTDPHADDPNACYGVECFRQTHLIVSALSLSCVMTSVCLMYASRNAYNRTGNHPPS